MTNNLKINMFALDPDLRHYILSHKDYIKSHLDELDIDGLYDNVEMYNKIHDVDITPQLTGLLYNINIDPLDYLTKVPKSFMDSFLVHMDIILPNNITAINNFAFADSWLHTLTIPTTCNYFGGRIFENCKNLSYIIYNGTISEFRSISKDTKWRLNIDSSSPVWVKCVDGRYDIHDV